ncbi:MAG: carbon-nitrogen hydrolase family protein [Gemmatimonadetes bacterium]|nr:carbon-nitrogen hydrolase family protein [Gemmatimonadota bacterium]
MFRDVRVAAISFKPVKLDLKGNADRLEKMFRDAAADGAELAVAPEGVLEGYVVNEIIDGEIPPEEMNRVALTMRSRTIGRFRELARTLNMCLAFGLAERIDGEIYNCAVFLDHRGRLRGKYHKMQLAEGHHRSWWFNRLGKNSRAFDTPFGRAGMVICNDRWNPDIARIPVLDGARYLLIPSFGSTARSQDRAVLARARENGVPIVEANVGVTLIVNKGEIVALSRKMTAITHGTISVPATPSLKNRDRHERGFLAWRSREMPVRYRDRMRRKRQGRDATEVGHDSKGRLIEVD